MITFNSGSILKKISKLYLGIFLLAIIFSFSFNYNTCFADVTVTEKQYARITRSNIPIYDTPDATVGKILFYPEISYFVQILQPESSNFYKIKYMDIEGYILSSDLVFISGTPLNPFPSDVNIKILANGGLNLRSSPTSSEGPFNIITTLPFLENNIQFIGRTHGEEYAPGMSDLWYYCRYYNNQSYLYGYLYSVYCYPLAEIKPNLEQFDIVDKPYFPEISVETQTNNDALSKLPKEAQIVVIIVVCAPCILIVYLLFKPTKLQIDNGKTKKKKFKRLKKSDYYEFDD